MSQQTLDRYRSALLMLLFYIEPGQMFVYRVAQVKLPFISQLHDTDGGKYFADTAHAIECVCNGRAKGL